MGIFTDEEQADIEYTKNHLDVTIRRAVLELDETMIIAMVSFSFPFQFLVSYVYSRLTNRNFVLRFTTIFDLGITALVIVWFIKFEQYIFAENRGMGISDPPHEHHIFMQ